MISILIHHDYHPVRLNHDGDDYDDKDTNDVQVMMNLLLLIFVVGVDSSLRMRPPCVPLHPTKMMIDGGKVDEQV